MAFVSFEDGLAHFEKIKPFLGCPPNELQMELALSQIDEDRKGYAVAYLALRAIQRIMADHEEDTGEVPPTLDTLHNHLVNLKWLLDEPINLIEPISFEVIPVTEKWAIVECSNRNPSMCRR